MKGNMTISQQVTKFLKTYETYRRNLTKIQLVFSAIIFGCSSYSLWSTGITPVSNWRRFAPPAVTTFFSAASILLSLYQLSKKLPNIQMSEEKTETTEQKSASTKEENGFGEISLLRQEGGQKMESILEQLETNESNEQNSTKKNEPEKNESVYSKYSVQFTPDSKPFEPVLVNFAQTIQKIKEQTQPKKSRPVPEFISFCLAWSEEDKKSFYNIDLKAVKNGKKGWVAIIRQGKAATTWEDFGKIKGLLCAGLEIYSFKSLKSEKIGRLYQEQKTIIQEIYNKSSGTLLQTHTFNISTGKLLQPRES